MVELKVGRNDKNAMLVITIVIIIILLVLFILISTGADFYNSLVKPSFLLPEWLLILFLIIVVAVVGYIGVIIWNHSGKQKQLLFTLWVFQLALLFGAFVAFFQRQSIDNAAYLLMLFLAVHVAMTYQLQFIDSFSFGLYLVGALWMIYTILTVLEFSRLNSLRSVFEP